MSTTRGVGGVNKPITMPSMKDEATRRLDAAMTRLGIKNAQLARIIGATRQMVGELRNGGRRMSKDWAEKIAPHLETTWHELLGAPSEGFSEPAETYEPVAGTTPALSFEQQMAEIADAVAAMLREENMPADQRSITLLSFQVWRDMKTRPLDPRLSFQDRLEFVLSERRSLLRQHWQKALKGR